MEPMAGGYGARPYADGIDTGGLFCIPMGRIPDVGTSSAHGAGNGPGSCAIPAARPT